MAKRKPLVFIAGEIVESKISDTIDGNNIVVTTAGTPTERLLKDRFNDIINVKDYGAKGNGIADDTAAFQAAAIAAEDKNAVVYVPYGVYKVSEPVEGEFISFGHPTITGEGSVTFLLDLYNDLVHKTQDVDETITGDKTFTGKTTFNEATDNKGTETHSGNETHTGSEIHNGSVTFNGNVNLSDNAVITLIEDVLAPENNGFTTLTNTNGKLRVNADEFVKANSGLATELQNNIKKLKIDLSNANAETLDTITSYLIKPNSGLSVDPTTKKLQVDFQDLTVDQLTPLCDPDGGIIINNDEESDGYGKLKIDFGSMDPAIMRAIVYAMTQQGGGLSVDSNGQLFVDFDSMPTDKFEAMLKAIHVPIWLNNSKHFYVNNNQVDGQYIGQNTDDGEWGHSAEKPWRTIAFATETICKNYNINSRSVYIDIAGGTYQETITLPQQQRTTGNITLQPLSDNDVVSLGRTVTAGGTVISHTGGRWIIKDIDLFLIVGVQTSTTVTGAILVSSEDTDEALTLQHCNITFTDNSDPYSAGVKGKVQIRLIRVNGGHIIVRNNNPSESSTAQYECLWTGNIGNADLVEWIRNSGGVFEFAQAGPTAPRAYAVNVSGSFSTFCSVTNNGVYKLTGSGPAAVWTEVDSPTGKKFAATDGGKISTGLSTGSGAAAYFPGDTAGTVDADTYSWISPAIPTTP